MARKPPSRDAQNILSAVDAAVKAIKGLPVEAQKPARKRPARAAGPAKRAASPGAAPRRPATPIVTEHTHGQAHPAPVSAPSPQEIRRIQAAQAAESLRRAHAFRARAVNEQSMVPHGAFGFAANVIGNIAQDAVYAPAGVAALGENVGRDAADVRHGDLGFDRTRGIGGQIINQTVEQVMHPLRRPGDTLLLGLAGAGAAARAVSGVSAASRAAAAGAGAREAARALVKKPVPGEIDLPGGVQALEADHPLWRPVQRRRALNPKPGTVGREIRAREQVLSDLDKAPITAARNRAKKLTPEENTAVRLIAIEGDHTLLHPADVVRRQAATHRQYAAEGHDPTLNLEIAKDIEAALPVLTNPSPEFLNTVEAIRKVSNKSGQDLIGPDRLAADQASGALGKVAAEYGHKGAPQPTKRAAFEANLNRSEKALDQHARRVKARIRRSVRGFETPELKAAVAEEKAAHVASEQASRARSVAADRVVKAEAAVQRFSERVRGAQFRRAAEGKGASSALLTRVQAQRAAEAELAAARKALHRSRRDADGLVTRQRIAGERRKAAEEHMQVVHQDNLRQHNESLKQITAQRNYLTAQRARLASGTEAPEGSFYFPMGDRFKHPSGRGAAMGGPGNRKPGPHGLGPPQPASYVGGTLKQRTMKGNRRGVVQRPGEAITTRAAGTARLASVERIQAQLKSLSTPERTHEDQFFMRDGPISAAIREQVAAELEQAATGDATALVRARDALQGVQGRDEGVWVDKNYLKEMAAQPGGHLRHAARTVTKPFRFAGVYARPAYVVQNRPQNFIMRHMSQGRTHRVGKGGTVKAMRERLGDDLSEKIIAASGEARTESYMPHEISRGGRAEKWAVEKITNATDRDERFLAVLKRAAEKGYESEQDIARLFADQAPPKVVNDRVAIARRARKDMADFSSLTPFERELSDVVYFYPWLSRGSVWAGRWAANHPVSTAGLAQLSQIGKEYSDKRLGPVPRWMQGHVPIGGRVVNPANLWTPSTPVEIGNAIKHPGPAGILGEFQTPAVSLATSKGVLAGIEAAVKSTAPGQIAVRSGLVGKPSATFPDTGPLDAIGPFVGGGMYPRRPDKASVASQAARDNVKGGKAANTIARYEAKLNGQTPTPALRKAIDLAGQRAEARRKYPKTNRGRLYGDLDLAVQLGMMTPANRDGTLRNIAGISDKELGPRLTQEGYSVTDGARNDLFDPDGLLGQLNG